MELGRQVAERSQRLIERVLGASMAWPDGEVTPPLPISEWSQIRKEEPLETYKRAMAAAKNAAAENRKGSA